jgi:hypothetical protein
VSEVDPASIPPHVVKAARDGHAAAGDDRNPWRWAVVAALAALMDDEPVSVLNHHGNHHWVRPSDVLRAVLAR